MPFKSVYVQSRGVSHKYDYQWKKITLDEQQQDDAKFILPLNEFLDTEYEPFSLLIARTEEGLCLLITRLRSNRKDFQSRVIRNSLAFIFDEEQVIFDEEREIRGLAVRFLDDEKSIRKKLDQIITDDDNDNAGFHVKYDDFCELFSDNVNGIGDGQPENKYLIGKTSPTLLSDLADTLRKTKLPQEKEKEILVVVTGFKKPETLANVWRGLCSLEKSKDWRTSAPQKKMPRKMPKAIVLVLVVILCAMPWNRQNKLENPSSDLSSPSLENTTTPDNGSKDKQGQESHPDDTPTEKPPEPPKNDQQGVVTPPHGKK
ncbi:hypothetical protein PN36_32290 [Candidatus Thiomargarita nelsonii]|uniref:Uncharacterized protein n=1 Tax=Candidatus Thiomargarita nelsonii TaxID=1003181 RepID=A0A0A6PHV3_9GAMM|nr:hypothetical protein PN36_32290 [Candidatus Thiomargarita nelsonii]